MLFQFFVQKMFRITPLKIPEVSIIETDLYPDERGLFFEFYKRSSMAEYGFPDFVQDNISFSKKNVIRGLHFQSEPYAQGKLVTVLKGSIFDVAVDIRKNSPTFGKCVSACLYDVYHKMIYIPPGFAHGFCALSHENIILYKNTREYFPEHDNGIIWNDPEIGINWPCKCPIVSEKDSTHSTLKEIINQE